MSETEIEMTGRMSEPPLWDAADVATYLGASRSWVYSAAKKGHLPSMRFWGLVRFDPQQVRDWARQQRVELKSST